MRPIPLLALPLLVAACVAPGTPQSCAAPVLRELARIEPLIVRSERALALGYRERRVAVPRTEVAFCTGRDGRLRTCLRDGVRTRIVREAIDPAAERRIRDNLVARRAALTREARRREAACAPAVAANL